MKVLKKIGKIAGLTLCSILAAALLAVGVLNLAKFAIYRDFYAVKTDVCINPGLGDGFICQGIAAVEKEGKILVSGYMMDDSPSRIYVTGKDNRFHYVNLTQNGKAFTGHVGGIATAGDKVYLSTSSRIFTLSLVEILSARDGMTVDVGEGVVINNKASYVYADEDFLYVGTYFDKTPYSPDHVFETAAGTQSAICTKYALGDLQRPLAVYSVPDFAQGIAFADGLCVISTSHGLNDSVYFVYRLSDVTDSGTELDGAPVYFFESPLAELHGPAMGEDLDFSEGKFISLTESASNKYIFGKFFGAYSIFALDLSKYAE
jgi:hypothetical protein